MSNENENSIITEIDDLHSFDFDELELKLQNDLDAQLSELEFSKEDREKLGNPERLESTIVGIVWEQFMNQLAATAGEEFIKENDGQLLDLRNEAHIQTADNFEKGNIATHNKSIDYQTRYDDWQSNFLKDHSDHTEKYKSTNSDDNKRYRKDVNNNVEKYDERSNSYKKVLTKDARHQFDKNRDKGSTEVNKDHVISAAEIIRSSSINAHLNKQEQIDFANSSTNLKDLDAAANQSKGDSTMNDWLNSKRNDKTPAERFALNEEKLIEDDRIAREKLDQKIKEGERQSIETGKQSQKEEAFKIAGKALRTVVMTLLAELAKEVIKKVVLWLKAPRKNFENLIAHLKSAIHSFIGKLKTHLVNAANSLLNTIATAIFGPIMRTVQKFWGMLKQGWKLLKEAIAFLKHPDNKDKPIDVLMLGIGKIVIAGLSATGAIALGGVIEAGLMPIPLFAFEIPIIGSLASLIGLFMGGLIAGVLGAIALNSINKAVVNIKLDAALKKEINQGNEVLNTQSLVIALNEHKLEKTKEDSSNSIKRRHEMAAKTIEEALTSIHDQHVHDASIINEDEDDFDDLLKDLNKLLE